MPEKFLNIVLKKEGKECHKNNKEKEGCMDSLHLA